MNKRARLLAQKEAAYKMALGLPVDCPLPKVLGTVPVSGPRSRRQQSKFRR